MKEEIEPVNQKGKENDLDLALDALRDCNTDFMKFVQVSVNTVIQSFPPLYSNLCELVLFNINQYYILGVLYTN